MWLIVWPLRKAAVLPAIAIGAVVLGGTVGAFNMTHRVLSLVFPVRVRKSGSGAVAWSAAIASGSGVIAIRELFFRPPIAPPPALPVDASLPFAVRLKNAGLLAAHTVANYPYTFRMTSAMAAGSIAAVAFVIAERFYNADAAARAAIAADSAAPKTEQSRPVVQSKVPANGFAASSPASRAPSASNPASAFDSDADAFASPEADAADTPANSGSRGFSRDNDGADGTGATESITQIKCDEDPYAATGSDNSARW
jgi:hypothetical protein